MRFLRFVRRHPITLLSVFAIAFVMWIWRDSFITDEPQHPTAQNHSPTQSRQRLLPAMFDESDGAIAVIEVEKAKPTPQDTAQVISKLKPGMTRAEVEGLVGVPAPGDISPATVADGRVTYHTTYEADFGPAATVRPIRIPRPQPAERDPNAKARTLVTLEYDATKPGHPLLGVHYPDPLF